MKFNKLHKNCVVYLILAKQSEFLSCPRNQGAKDWKTGIGLKMPKYQIHFNQTDNQNQKQQNWGCNQLSV